MIGCDENADRNQAFIKGRDALKQKDYTIAKNQLELAVKYDSNFAEAWNNLGIAYTELEKYEQAKEAYNQALLLDSCLEDAYQNKANLLFINGDIPKAIEILSLGLKCNSLNLSLLLNRATLYQQQKHFDIALLDLQKIKQLVQEDDVLFTNLGYCYYETNQLDSAFHYSLMALEINSERDEAVNNLGMISVQKEEFESAYKYFKKAVDMKPQKSLYRVNISKVALRLEKYEDACKNAKMAAYYDSKENYESLITLSCSKL